MDIRFENFRCFRRSEFVSIKPVTLLVGENSSGKTSFQAGLRYISTLSPFAQATFNAAPFNLGGFDEIAYNKAGVRSRMFSLSMRQNTREIRALLDERMGLRPAHLPSQYELTLRFSDLFGQPALAKCDLIAGERSLSIDLENATFIFRQKQPDRGIIVEFSDEMKAQIPLIQRSPGHLGIVFSNLQTLEYWIKAPSSSSLFKGSVARHSSELIKFRELILIGYGALFGRNVSSIQSIISLSPIRTEPRRVYEVSDTPVSPTGAHVPVMLAQEEFQAPQAWGTHRKYMARFGKNANIYEDVEIRRLGPRAIDPFQIIITLDGEKRNLIDVGYGVSQLLPLIYEMADRGNARSIWLQQPEVHLHPRAQAELGSAIVDAFKSSGHNLIVETHSDFILDRIKNDIRIGKLSNDDFALLYFERRSGEVAIHKIELDNAGNVINPPHSYREFFYREEKAILGI